jgi:hypothetical protein
MQNLEILKEKLEKIGLDPKEISVKGNAIGYFNNMTAAYSKYKEIENH